VKAETRLYIERGMREFRSHWGHKGRCAGQAVVQMARGKHDRREYAIKFFASRQGFDVEHTLYCSGSQAQASELAQFLPKVCWSASMACVILAFSENYLVMASSNQDL
jgi:hypothetical protein